MLSGLVASSSEFVGVDPAEADPVVVETPPVRGLVIDARFWGWPSRKDRLTVRADHPAHPVGEGDTLLIIGVAADTELVPVVEPVVHRPKHQLNRNQQMVSILT